MKSASNVWYVYILQCNDGRFYTGMTNSIEKRLAEHKAGRGARFTRSFGVKKLVYTERFATRSEAMKREAQIKRQGKQDKMALIKAQSSVRRQHSGRRGER